MITTPLVNQNGVYAGNMGHFYRQDYLTGQILARNDLEGLRKDEIRLAAPPDASLLVVGTYGYVLGLDPMNDEDHVDMQFTRFRVRSSIGPVCERKRVRGLIRLRIPSESEHWPRRGEE